MKNSAVTLNRIIDRQRTCYIGCVDADGYPNIKAMFRPRKHNGLREFFLSTNLSSQKAQIFQKNPKACLYFCNRLFQRGLMLKGTIEILEDQDSKTMLWEKGDFIYYREGVTDPDYCVLKFTATSARYYSRLKSVDLDVDEL